MPRSDSTFNELHIREKLILLSEIIQWMISISKEFDQRTERTIIDRVIDLMSIDTMLSYYIDYERYANSVLNKDKMENLKLKMDLDEALTELKILRETIENNL
tara:strand:+ start:2868 stop:3176 length:309 start_codon:yes stop_codon:yes gene_type:complete